MITINKASQRREFGKHTDFHIKTTFPGINLNNSEDMGLAQLGRIDYSEIKSGFMLRQHPHKNDEILSYIRKGTMTHKDTYGNVREIGPTHLMLMNAGSGLFHEEAVPKGGDDVDMIQIFMRPRNEDLPPNVQFSTLKNLHSVDNWRLVAGGKRTAAPLIINSEITVWDNHITTTARLNVAKNNVGLLYLFDGSIKVGDHLLCKGDSMVLDEPITIDVASPSNADLVYFEMDTSATYSRAGLFSG